MTVTLQQLYEYYDAKTLSYKIIIGGADVTPYVASFDYAFEVGQVPTATIEIPSLLLQSAVSEEANVEIWLGYKLGFIDLKQLVFGGGIINSVSYQGTTASIEVVMDGPRRLTFPYYKEVEYNFDNVTAQDSVVAILRLAGVSDFFVDLDAWDIGTAVPQKIKFSNYGEAINKVSEVDGSPWYAMPSGQVRVEKRDPLPYDTPARTYYSGTLIGPKELAGVVPDSSARPRNLEVSKGFDRAGVYNFIEVDGAVLVTLGPHGEQNSEQISEQVSGAPGSFSNGAPWIPTPPLYQMFTLQNELIDTDAKSNSTATRYYNLKNRLIEDLTVTVPIDPLLFLAETIKIIDPHTNTDDLYYLKAYHCSVSGSTATSELTLLGGPYSGTQGHAQPFAEFVWKYRSFYDQFSPSSPYNASKLNLGWQTDLGAKLIQDLPAHTGQPEQGGDLTDGILSVMITFDGSPSMDFDGYVNTWVWSDDRGNSGTGKYFTVMYNPDDGDSVQMTLTVTDDTLRTDTLTKTVYVGATAPPSPAPDDPTLDDTPFGGGAAAGSTTTGGNVTKKVTDGPGGKNGMALVYFVAAGCKMMATADNRTWNSIDKDDLGVGDFISVGMSSVYKDSEVFAVFGTEFGELVLTTDGCQTATVVKVIPGAPAITSILFDTGETYRVWAATENGQIWTSTDSGQTWELYTRLADHLPINKMLSLNSSLLIFGGDTGSPETLVRYQKDRQGDFLPVPFSAALMNAIGAAGPGFTVTAAAFNQQSLLIGFNGGVNTTTWVASNPLQDPSTWHATTGIDGVVKVAQAGIDGKFVVSTDQGIFHALNSDDFNLGDSTPVNDLAWEGLDGVYVGLKDSSVTKTTDGGRTQGDLVPSADFSNEDQWADCAVGHQIAIGVVPRDDDEGNWPAPNSTPSRATHWVSPGFNISVDPTWNAGIGRSLSNPLSGVVDLNAILLGSVVYPGPLDTDPNIEEFFYAVSATGPAPSATGLSIQWFNANGAVQVADNLAAVFAQSVDTCIFPAGTPKHLTTAISLPMPNSRFAALADQGASSINTINVGFSFWGGGLVDPIGPKANPAVTGVGDFTNFNIFPPHFNGYVFVTGATLEILVFP